jgi:hypothetical protein
MESQYSLENSTSSPNKSDSSLKDSGTSSELADDESSQATREKDKLAIKANVEILKKQLMSFIGSPFFQLI